MLSFSSFFFNDPATTQIYTLSLHDAFRSVLPDSRILPLRRAAVARSPGTDFACDDDAFLGRGRYVAIHRHRLGVARDRKSTRLNSSHANISYAVFCLKKKK